MQLDTGIPYTATIENITVPTNSGTAFDLVQLATSSTVPILVQRIVATTGALSSVIQRVSLLARSSASTGGTGITPHPLVGGASAATTVAYSLVTTTGTAGNQYDNQQWNEFAPYEFNKLPGGLFVPPSSWVCLFLPQAPASTFSASFTVEFVEFK